MGGQFSERNNFHILNDEDIPDLLGSQLHYKLSNHAFLNEETAIVVNGNVKIDSSLEEYCRKIRKKLKVECSSFIFTGNLDVQGRLEFNELEIIVLGKTICTSFIETSYNYFYGENVTVKKYAIFSRTSGCVIIEALQTPLIIASENYPIIESLAGNTVVFSSDLDASFVREKPNTVVHSPYDIQHLNPKIVKNFSLDDEDEDSSNLIESIYCQQEKFLKFLDRVSSIIKT